MGRTVQMEEEFNPAGGAKRSAVNDENSCKRAAHGLASAAAGSPHHAPLSPSRKQQHGNAFPEPDGAKPDGAKMKQDEGNDTT